MPVWLLSLFHQSLVRAAVLMSLQELMGKKETAVKLKEKM